MSDKLKELIKRAENWPEEAQKEAVTSLEAIEEDFVMDAEFAQDLKQARKEMKVGKGKPQEEVFEQFGL
jgi:hypothetical protein